MSDMNGMPSRSGEARLSCLLRSIDLTPQRRAPASDLLGRSRRGSVAAALLLVALGVFTRLTQTNGADETAPVAGTASS